MHAGLKRNFQVMPGAQWLELFCKHISDRYEHLVRYAGSPRASARLAAKRAHPHHPSPATSTIRRQQQEKPQHPDHRIGPGRAKHYARGFSRAP